MRRMVIKWAGILLCFLLTRATVSCGGNSVPQTQTTALTPSWTVGGMTAVQSLDQTDSDPSIILDSSGTFWLVRSDGVNTWHVYNGSNIDNIAETYAFNTVGQFPQPNGDDRYWIQGAWIDPATGTWYGIVHIEFDYGMWPNGSPSAHFRRIDLATSVNQGKTWQLAGDIITPYYPTQATTAAYPGSTYYYGDGDAKLFIDSATGYFYLYYMSAWFDKTTESGTEYIYVARAPISGHMAPGTWTKWYQGAFSQPGLGGQEDAISSGDSFLVWWNAYLGKYVGIRGLDGEVFLSSDLSSEAWEDLGNAGVSLEWYNWPIDNVTLRNRRITGSSFRLYTADNDYQGRGAEYRLMQFNAGAGSAPVASSTLYQIVDRKTGYAIGILNDSTQSGATVVLTASQSPPTSSQEWQFVSNGDGYYRLVNKSSGLALGVSPSGSAAWGSPLIQTPYTGSADQLWCIEPTEDGYVKLCNRNSDQVLGIAGSSSQIGAQAITWPDVFGAQDQELTMVAVSN